VQIVGAIFDPVMLTEVLVDTDLFVLPSEHENFGNSIAEAMACGVPVVISEGCGIAPLVVESGAGIVAPLDVDAFAGAMQKILGDELLTARMGNAGRRATADLSWDEPLDETEEMYGSMRAES
jgi:glycosyltransferase involved in cell wall biosynthesis